MKMTNNTVLAWLLCSLALAFAACDPEEETDDGGTDGDTDSDTEVVTDLSQGDITLQCFDIANSGDIYTETATFDLVNGCGYWPEDSELVISLRNNEQNHALELWIREFDGPGEYIADPGGTEDTVTNIYYFADDSGVTGYCDAYSIADPVCASAEQLTNPYCTIEVLDTNLIGLALGDEGWVSIAVTCEKLFQGCTTSTTSGQETTVVDPPDHRVEYIIAGCVNS